MKITVIHHSADFDGICCREIARKFLPDAELIGWDFKNKPLLPILDDERTYYVLDLPVDRVFGLDFSKLTTADEAHAVCDNLLNRVIWIDHHKSSIESHPPQFRGYRIDGVAACRLAWQWFANPQGNHQLPVKDSYIVRNVSEPLAVRLAGEYDIWDKRDSRADIFQYGLLSLPPNQDTWNSILGGEGAEINVDAILSDGAVCQSYQQRNDAGMMFRSFIVEFEGLKFLALTTARCNSLTFMSKDVPKTGHDALMGFYFDGKKWNVSLYHAKHNTGIDLSKIAVKFGGGGHRGACGFQTESLPFLK